MPKPLTAIALAAALLALAAPGPAPAASDPFGAPPPGEERFVYRWELKKLAALLGGILLPGRGEGLLTFEPRDNGHLQSELLITSRHSDEGEFWRYGALIDPDVGRTIRAWSSYLFRGESKSESAEIDQVGVIDVASGIYQIRRDLPEKPRRMRIWSDGKIYPVVVLPVGDEVRTLPGGRRVETVHYRIRGVDLPGERFWKGHMDLWLAKDAGHTPVEIHFDRTLMGVRLRLDQPL
ncbi:MAG TPA: DUF3108 domain-containing protein [Thermoanaerobaculia bacterium]|nr:DUF3108 domain-containing protein [Thermoanaerobaculia bacterium]